MPKQKRGPRRKDDRKILNGIFYILRTGAPWRDLPARYDPRTTVYNRYIRWGRPGIWKGIFDTLAKEDEDSLVFIDASIVKAHRAVASAKKRGFAKVLDAHAAAARVRVHAAIDAKGRPLRLGISVGQVHDSRMIDLFLDWDKPPLAIVADKAYGSSKIRQQMLTKPHWLSSRPKAMQEYRSHMIKTSMPCAILWSASFVK